MAGFVVTQTIARNTIGNRAAAFRLLNRCRTDRVCWALLADSNGMYEDHGFSRALDASLAARFKVFGTGIMSYRQLGNQDVYGKSNVRRLAQTPSGNSKQFGNGGYIAFTGASYVHATRTLTGTFTGYVHATGNNIAATSGTGVTPGDFTIASGNASAVVLSGAGLGAGADGAANIAGTIYFVPAQYRKYGNWPTSGTGNAYLPHCHIFVADGVTAFQTWSHMIQWRMRSLGLNGPMIQSTLQVLSSTAGGSFRMDAYKSSSSDPSAGFVNLTSVGGGSTKSTNGTDGTLAWATETAGFTADAERITGSNYRLLAGVGMDLTITGPATLLYNHFTSTKRPYGVSFNPYMYRGGDHRYEMGGWVNGTTVPTDTTAAWARAIVNQFKSTSGGSSTGGIGIVVLSSYNDASTSNTSTSRGVAAVASNTVVGFTDNAKYIIGKLEESIIQAITDEGLTATNVDRYYILCTEHATSEAPTAAPSVYTTEADRTGWIRLYEASDKAYAESTAGNRDGSNAPQVISVAMSQLVGWAEAMNQRFAAIGADGADPTASANYLHGEPGLYDLYAARMFDAMDFWTSESVAAVGASTGGLRGRTR